jgi:ankyrin repeat protein
MITHRSAKTAPATFDHLPLHLQSHIFTLSTAPPDTCKVAAAITQDLQLAAEWLLTKHQQEKEPLHLLRTAAKHKHWGLCAWAVQHKRYWSTGDMNKTLLAATRAGQVDLAHFLLQQQGGWAGWLWTEPKLQTSGFNCEHHRFWCRQCTCKYKALLATKPDLDYIDNEVESLVLEEPHPLVQAAKQGHKELFALFLQQGANIQAAGQALEAAAGGGYMELVQMLFTKMPRMTRQLEAVRAAVCAAAGAGHLSVIQCLIFYAPAVKQPGLGPSPLVTAAEGGQLHVMRFFLQKYGVSTAYGFSHCDWSSPNNWPSPCAAAAEAGSVEALQLLVDSGYRWISSQWVTAFRYALDRGHAPVVKMLLAVLASGAVSVRPHQYGYGLVLWDAARHGHTEAVQLLLKDVPNPEEVLAVPDNVLHVAAASGHAEVVRIILQRCKRRRDLDCITAFRLAANEGHFSVLQQLNGYGGANASNDEYAHGAPLKTMIQKQSIKAVQWLLEQGAKANQQALLDALQQRSHPILQLLVQHGVEDVGDRALYVAAQLGDIPAVELLLSAAQGKQQQEGTQAVSTRMEVALCGAASRGRVKLGLWLVRSTTAAAAAAAVSATAPAGAQPVAGAAQPEAQLVPEQPSAAATGAESANPGATATEATAPLPVPPACTYTPAILNKALEAVIRRSSYRYKHPTHQELWWDWKLADYSYNSSEGSSHALFARLLVKAGADTQSEEYGKLVLRALELEHIPVFKALMKAGPVPAVVRDGRALKAVVGRRFALEKCCTVLRYTDPAGCGAALLHACDVYHDPLSAVGALLKRGADVNHDNGAPLQAAMTRQKAHAAALLLLHGAHVEERQVEQLYSMVAKEEGGAQLARALEVRGVHLKAPPASRGEGAGAAHAPATAQAV